MVQHSNQSHEHQPTYAAFLVRMWQQTPNMPWCASAQSVQGSEVIHFGSVEALCTFLEQQTNNVVPTATSSTPTTLYPDLP